MNRDPTTDSDDLLRGELARRGVPLFEPTPAQERPSIESADLVTRLVESPRARLRAALPCLLVAMGDVEASAAMREAAGRRPHLRPRLGWWYRLARALATSRRFDVEWLTRRACTLPPLAIEPADLPEPAEGLGRDTLWVASARAQERGEPDAAGDAADLFDTWLRLRAVERRVA